MDKKETVWVVTGKNEGGDDFLAIFKNKPTSKQLDELAHGWDGDDEREGPGDYGSYVYLNVLKETLL